MRLQRIAVLWTLGISNNLFLGLPAGYLKYLKTEMFEAEDKIYFNSVKSEDVKNSGLLHLEAGR